MAELPASGCGCSDGYGFPIEQDCFVETGPSILTKLDEQLVYSNHTYIFTNRKLTTKDHLENALRVAPRNQRILNSVVLQVLPFVVVVRMVDVRAATDLEVSGDYLGVTG